MSGGYDGRCATLDKPHQTGAIRLVNNIAIDQFNDQLSGLHQIDKLAAEDFILKRRDGLYAYQLAVVLDDIYQGITEVVRGADLLYPTCRQLSLYQVLQTPAPQWLHLH